MEASLWHYNFFIHFCTIIYVFSDEELKEIEQRADTELTTISESRDRDLNDLYNQRKRIYTDLDYIKRNKITLLRNQAYNAQEYSQDVRRLENELDEVDSKLEAYKLTEKEMLDYILTFSELIKNAKLYYKQALDTEKHEIAIQVFSELVIYNEDLAETKVKEGFEALLNRHKCLIGSAGGI